MNDTKHQYNPDSIDEKTVDRDPLKLFQRWLDEAEGGRHPFGRGDDAGNRDAGGETVGAISIAEGSR